MAESYISQFYSWSTSDTITAARLNGNVTNLISGLQDGDKALNVLKVLGASQQFMTADGSNITLQNIDTYSGKDNITIYKAENDGNPSIDLGATALEVLEINSVYDSGAQTLDYIEIQTKAASATADKGQIKFLVDESAIFNIVDGGISLLAGKDLLMSSTSDITVNTDKFTVAGASGNTVIAGTLDVTGAIGSTASITLGAGADLIGSSTSDIMINTNKFTVAGATGNTLIAGTLDVTGVGTFTAQTVHTNGLTDGTATLDGSGALSGLTTLAMSSDFTVNTNKFTVAGSTGNTVIAGTLGVAGAVTFNDAGADVDFRVEGVGQANALFVQGSDGFVGIGTALPDGPLHVHKASAGTVTANANSTLVIEKDGTNYLNFLGPNDSFQGILFGDVADNDIGAIFYDHSSNNMSFSTNASSALTIDSTGKAGFGTATPGATVDILNASDAQMRLTSTAGSYYSDIRHFNTGAVSWDFYGTGGSSLALQNTTADLTTNSMSLFLLANDDADSSQQASIVFTADTSGNYTRFSGGDYIRLGGSVNSTRAYSAGAFAIKDGITAPSTLSGFAQLYVDTADGDLKVKFGDGTVKTISVDT